MMNFWKKISNKSVKKAALFLCCAIYTQQNLVSIAVVDGPSMDPYFNPRGYKSKDVVLISRWIRPDFKNIRKNDVIVFKSPTTTMNELLIKRLLYINGELVRCDNNSALIVPPGHVWVEGDNKYLSRDSREFGPISLGLVIGKPIAIIWPPSRIELLKSNFSINTL